VQYVVGLARINCNNILYLNYLDLQERIPLCCDHLKGILIKKTSFFWLFYADKAI
jgi:hypothetical protein